MQGWRMWTASAIGAMAAGAGLAVARRRRPEPLADGSLSAAPAAPSPADVQVPPAHAPAEEDPQAALDAARERLRERADLLRREIESDGDPSAADG